MSRGLLFTGIMLPILAALLVGSGIYVIQSEDNLTAASLLSHLPFINGDTETAVAARSDLATEIKFIGTVSDTSRVDLFFEKEGKVKTVDVAVGDIVTKETPLASIEASALQHRMLSSLALLKSAESRLLELESGTRSEEVAVRFAAVRQGASSVDNKNKVLLEEYHSAYAAAHTAVSSYVDQFFDNPTSGRPNFKGIDINNYDAEGKRVEIGELLKAWKKEAGLSASTSDAVTLAEEGKKRLTTIRDFVNTLSLILNHPQNFNETSSATIQTALDNITGALLNLTTALDAYYAAVRALDVAERELELAQAGERGETVEAQRAQVAYYGSLYEEHKAEYEKSILYSPFDGVVAKENLDIGALVNPQHLALSIVSTSTPTTVEANVSELNIAAIKVGDAAGVTLDALPYGATYEAKVLSVELAETTINSVPTYKVTLQFTQPVTEALPGMTANVLLTGRRANVLTIPLSAIRTNGGGTMVRVIRDGKPTEVPVSLGMYGGTGNIEVYAGISEGERVILNEN